MLIYKLGIMENWINSKALVWWWGQASCNLPQPARLKRTKTHLNKREIKLWFPPKGPKKTVFIRSKSKSKALN